MRIIFAPLAALALVLTVTSVAQEDEGRTYFSLSTNRSYSPGEKPSVQLWADGVNQLQFRVYKVNDPIAFFRQLDDPHRFGGQSPRKRPEPTPLERFHSWKLQLKTQLRNFIRAQYTGDSRAEIREWMARRDQRPVLPQTSAVATQYAEVPLLNPQQVVAVWEQNVNAKGRWNSTNVPVDVQDPGLYLVEATSGKLNAYTITSLTNLAIVAKGAPGRILARLVDRKSGAPVSGSTVILQIDQKETARAETDRNGMAEFRVAEVRPESILLMARRGQDFAVATMYSWFLSTNRNAIGYIYTDRPVYRPGHQVNFRTILRDQGDDAYALPLHKEVQVQVQAPDGKVAYTKKLPVSGFGTVKDSLTIAGDAALGYYNIEVQAGEARANGGFQVEEYRKPEFAVTVRPAKRRLVQGEPMEAEIEARYFYGEPVAAGKVTYVVHKSRYWAYGWRDEDAGPGEEDVGYGSEQVLEASGALDGAGKLTVKIPNEPGEDDLQYWIEARVSDASNREVSGFGSVIATVGPYRINVQGDKYMYEPGEKGRFRIETRDYDDRPVSDVAFLVEVRGYRYEGREQLGRVLKTANGKTDAHGNATVEIEIPDGGSLVAVATADAGGGRRVRDSAYFWVSGEGSWDRGQQRLTLVPDKRLYSPGDVAKILVVTGVPKSQLWVTAEGRGIRNSQFIDAKDPTVTVEIPIGREYAPNFFVTALFLHDGQLYQGTKSIKVPPTDRELKVELTSSKEEYKPGEAGTFSLLATDSEGQPVSAEFSVGVVDEAIYSVRKERMPEILSFFYGQTYNRVAFSSSLSYHFSGEAGKRRMQLARAARRKTRAQLKPADFVQPQVRKAFPDTILWLADVQTDANGRATARVTYPDALTTWRATARGVTRDTKVGLARDYTTVRKNLILRLAVPRFFTEGDEVTVSAIVHNYLQLEKQVRVSLEVQGLEIIDGKTTDVNVATRQSAKVDFRVRAVPGAEAVLLAKALTDEESDALELRIPIVPYGVKLTESQAGALTDSAQQAQVQFTYSPEVVAHSRKIDISLTPSVAGTILGALDYLTSYPYGCTEQTMSSFLPNVIVSQVARDLNLKTGLNPGELAQKTRAGLTRLYSFQHPDGGWGWWQSDDSDAFMTAYVIAGLKQADNAGYQVQPNAREQGVEWLRGQLRNLPEDRADLPAYVAYSLALNGTFEKEFYDRLWAQRGKLSPYGQALLGLALQLAGDTRAAEIARALEATVKKDTGGTYWQSDRDWLLDIDEATSPEATAYALKLLTMVRPQSPLLESTAMWLVRNRNRGSYWSSTKQTAFVIYGLIDYLKSGRELSPNFGVTVRVNGKDVLTRRFVPGDSLTTTPVALQLTAAQLEAGTNRIEIIKNGEGRLYWSAQSNYYTSRDSFSQAGDKALSVLREYYRVTPLTSGEKIVHRLDPLTGEVAPGDVVAVRLTVDGGAWRYLLIEDPIPAGTEFIQRDELYELSERPDWWSLWAARREFHDDRAAFYQNYFAERTMHYVYLLKVVNPGQFRVSPARVSPMYQPEFIATSDSKSVEVR